MLTQNHEELRRASIERPLYTALSSLQPSHKLPCTSQSIDDSVIRILGLVVAVEQQGGGIRAPRVLDLSAGF